jgi:hypothetical protein
VTVNTENTAVNKIYYDLAVAFAGYSQVSDKVLGMAIKGHVNNGNLGTANLEELCDRAAAAVADRWDRWEEYPKIRSDIAAGMLE